MFLVFVSPVTIVALGEVKCEDSRLDCSSDCLGEDSSRATEQTPTILTGDDVSEMMAVDDEHVTL